MLAKKATIELTVDELNKLTHALQFQKTFTDLSVDFDNLCDEMDTLVEEFAEIDGNDLPDTQEIEDLQGKLLKVLIPLSED